MPTNTERVAKLLGKTKPEALAFCLEVQKHFDYNPPPFYVILEAIRVHLKQCPDIKPEPKHIAARIPQTERTRRARQETKRQIEARAKQAARDIRPPEAIEQAGAEPKQQTVSSLFQKPHHLPSANRHKEMGVLQNCGIQYLYHMTSITNLRSILENGLLSHNEVYRRKLILRDISMDEVQAIRHYKRDPIYGRLIHEYASLYFSPRNAMLYKRKDLQDTLVILGIEPSVLLSENTIFTDGNAAASNTRFYKEISQVSQLPWDVIKARYWTDYLDGKRIKCAEALVYPKVESGWFNYGLKLVDTFGALRN